MTKQGLLNVMITVGLILPAAACGASEPANEAAEPPEIDNAAIRASIESLDLDMENFPRLDCSTSAQPLMMTVLGAIFDQQISWRMSPRDGEWRMRGLPPGKGPIAVWGADLLQALDEEHIRRLRAVESHLSVSGTHGAYGRVIEGRCDLAAIARKPSEDEKKAMEQAGVELDVVPVALDAFVFIVHPDNPVEGLTLEQVRGIFTGEITNWKEVGGPDHRINPYTRQRNSGSQELMIDLVMGDRTFAPHAGSAITYAMFGPMDMMSHDRHGISYTVHYYNRYMAPPLARRGLPVQETPREALPPAEAERREDEDIELPPRARMLAIDGLEPGPESIADGTYPLIEPVYLVTRKDLAEDAPAARLRDWLLSPEGQAVVRRSLYVDRKGNAP